MIYFTQARRKILQEAIAELDSKTSIYGTGFLFITSIQYPICFHCHPRTSSHRDVAYVHLNTTAT